MIIIGLPTALCIKRKFGGGASSELFRPSFPATRAFVSMGARI